MPTRLPTVLAAGIAALGLVFGVAAPAAAEDPFSIGSAYVVDNANVVSDGDEDRIEQATDELYDETGMQMYVVYVGSFEGDENWADETADLSQLGSDSILLAVATDDRVFRFSKLSSFPLSTSELDDVANDWLVPELRDDQWADGAIQFAAGLQEAQTGSAGSGTSDDGTGDENTGSSTGGFFAALGGVALVFFLLIAVIIVVIVVIVVRRGRRRVAPAPPQPTGPSLEELDKQASRALVQLDDEVSSSEQELGFAIAEFGEQATVPFNAALASAKAKLTEAFGLRQRLDDAEPDTDQQKHDWTTRIIELCSAADRELDEQADAFAELREVEKNAPAVLDAATSAASTVTANLQAAESRIAGLAARFSPTAIAPVAKNAEQARSLLTLATSTITEARAAFDAGKRGEAALGARTAQASVDQAAALLAAVDSAGAALEEAAANLQAEITESEQDVREAQASGRRELEPVIAQAVSAIEFARTNGVADPVSSLSRLEKQSGALDSALDGIREQSAHVQRASAQLDRAIVSARNQIRTADEYITTRRGGVSSEPRTRLASAKSHLQTAIDLRASDPVAALEEASRALDLAEEATRRARSDIDDDDWTGGFGGGRGGGGNPTGAVIGGVLAGILLGGGNRGGGMFGGGGGWGGGGFGGGFGGSGHSGGGGGFGGGGGGFGGGGGGFGGGGGRF